MYSAVGDEEACATIHCALRLGLTLLDTAPLYGHGLAEARLGSALATVPRDAYILATKVGYVVRDVTPAAHACERGPAPEPPRDYSFDGAMRSASGSLERLRLDRIDILHIHDPEDHFREAMEGAYRALDQLRAQGVVRAIGAGMNQPGRLVEFALAGDFDCFLLAGRYTLLDQAGLQRLLPLCLERGIAIFVGGPFNSGILADPYDANVRFDYEPAAQAWVDKARRIDAVCERHGVPLKAAAIQFPLAHPAVASVLTGARSTAEIEENVRMANLAISPELWAELKAEGLLPEEAPTPG